VDIWTEELPPAGSITDSGGTTDGGPGMSAPADLLPGSQLPARPPGQIIEAPGDTNRRGSTPTAADRRSTAQTSATMLLRRFRSEDMVLEKQRSRSSRSEGQLPPFERQSSLKRATTEKQLNIYETLESNSDLLTTGPTKALWSVWVSLDVDRSGALSRHEFNEVNRILQIKWDRAAAWRSSLALQQLQDLHEQLSKKVACANGECAALPEENEDVDATNLTCTEPEIGFRAFVSVYNQVTALPVLLCFFCTSLSSLSLSRTLRAVLSTEDDGCNQEAH
jgi:hypothetical protein